MEQVKAEPVACPFCDSEARIVAPLGAANVRAVECWNSNCAATGPWASNESKAITAWNRRANPQPAAVDGLVERYRHALERIADPANIHFAGDAQVVARQALAQIERKPEDGNG